MPRGRGQGHGWCQGRLAGYGYRLTLARQAVLQVLNSTDKHLSAEEVYIHVHKIHPSGGLATVYRTLELLTELGVVFKHDFGDGRARYELARGSQAGDHHHHLICERCNRVINYRDFIDEEVELLKKTEKGLARKYNFRINRHIMQFYGLCEKCKPKE